MKEKRAAEWEAREREDIESRLVLLPINEAINEAINEPIDELINELHVEEIEDVEYVGHSAVECYSKRKEREAVV